MWYNIFFVTNFAAKLITKFENSKQKAKMNAKNFSECDCGRIYASLNRKEKSNCIIFLCQNIGDSIFTWAQRLPKWAKGEIPNKMKQIERKRVFEIFQRKEWE